MLSVQSVACNLSLRIFLARFMRQAVPPSRPRLHACTDRRRLQEGVETADIPRHYFIHAGASRLTISCISTTQNIMASRPPSPSCLLRTETGGCMSSSSRLGWVDVTVHSSSAEEQHGFQCRIASHCRQIRSESRRASAPSGHQSILTSSSTFKEYVLLNRKYN